MSAESAMTGEYGCFYIDDEKIARGTQWSVNTKLAHTSEWGDSDSKGWTNRAAGRLDRTFTSEGKYDSDDEVYNVFDVGDTVSADLYQQTSDSPSGDAVQWQFPRALCMDFKLSVNMDTEEVIGWTSDWGGDGVSYRPGTSP